MKITKFSLIALLATGSLLSTPVLRAQEQDKKPAESQQGGQAQGERPRGRGIEEQLNQLTTQLSLTDEQKPKVKALLEEQQKQRQGFRELSQDERRTKMQALREETNTKMKAILTEEQFKKYEALPRGQRQGGPGGQRPNAPEGEKKADAPKN